MSETLRRYTDVLSLLDILKHKRLTLLSPSRWFDQNDRFGLNPYSARRGPGSVYALCMAEGKEQAHHWQIFAGHGHGLCIVFDRDKLVAHLSNPRFGLLHGPVVYENLKQIRQRKPIDLDVLPFLKRDTFQAEEEYRVVGWQDEFFAEATLTVPLPLSIIRRVVMGPAMPETLARTLKDIACQQDGCGEIPFSISRLVSNESWTRAIAEGVGLK